MNTLAELAVETVEKQKTFFHRSHSATTTSFENKI
jgi:hypothetical protein